MGFWCVECKVMYREEEILQIYSKPGKMITQDNKAKRPRRSCRMFLVIIS